MKRFLSLLCVLSFAAAALGEERQDPNSLTPEQIQRGCLLLFDGKTTFGWKFEGDAKVEGGELVLGGAKETVAWPTTDFNAFGSSVLIVEKVSGGPITLGNGVVLGESKTKGSAGMNLFPIRVSAGKVVRISGIKLQPLGSRPLFNGKDLTGWKKFEATPARAKSEFTIEDDTIRLKNGPGDLQSDEQFADFILQVECRTNGPRLNSGVFFRCIPGLYQQGYEAQIHNAFTPTPAREYTIEEYDPATHELKSKSKVRYTATDFGTGAIYRRIPARGPAAKDNEWFTMTVVANGKHLATWVNGVQQTDWVDNRPLSDNARNGCRLEKGAISLQGHDKTTDLSFRNIRITELPKAK